MTKLGRTKITVGEILGFAPCGTKSKEFIDGLRKKLKRAPRNSDRVTYRTIAQISGLQGLRWVLCYVYDANDSLPQWLNDVSVSSSSILLNELLPTTLAKQKKLIKKHL